MFLTVAGVLLILVAGLLLGRHFGFITWPLRRGQRDERVLYEDALKHIYKSETSGRQASVSSIGGQLGVSLDQAAEVVKGLLARKLLRAEGEEFRLSDEGRDYALHVIRAHRLWERYLADQTGVAPVDWHGRAEVLEHALSPDELADFAARLGNPTHDPHGDPLPTPKGKFAHADGKSLLALENGERGRIVHLEDEPASVYARLLDQSLSPGMELRLLSRDADGLHLRVEGVERSIDTQAAANVTVRPLPEGTPEEEDEGLARLSQIRAGESAEVTRVSRTTRAPERRRFMDLGVLPGTVITAEFAAPGGDPMAYRIRGALIALRREQADQILVKAKGGTAA
jgi:DtxR family transcriptional regulator, Mn-dependent transcriptional regulator